LKRWTQFWTLASGAEPDDGRRQDLTRPIKPCLDALDRCFEQPRSSASADKKSLLHFMYDKSVGHAFAEYLHLVDLTLSAGCVTA